MKKLKYIVLLLLLVLIALTGCGNDKVVLMTTEDNQVSDTKEITESEVPVVQIEDLTTEEKNREEATAEEKNITIAQIYEANSGDVFLKDGKGYSVNTIYYSHGTEVYSELQYLGFDEYGMYMQAYEDSEGYVEVLDSGNLCWYIVRNGQVSTLIYPENGMADIMIDYSHNDMVISDPASSGETIVDVYKLNGDLVVETSLVSEFDEEYLNRYVLDENYRIITGECYEEDELISSFWTTENAVYNESEELTAIRSDLEKRLVTVSYPDGSGVEYIYQIPRQCPVELKLFASVAYADEACNTKWVEINPMSDGFYADENIYVKKVN
ncbi:MAG: hypothetical protein E7258_02850 [Lachnospiraceae bacterium]|nr:hypothetical protein [Lachnospiraceae bacterium]